MTDFNMLEKENLKVLGVIVRVNRVKLGYSLRDLAKLTNISHTLISNFEKGKLIPHSETIKDIFRILDLHFYDDHEISVKFKALYQRTFKHILFHEYGEAKEIILEIEKDQEIYESSVEVINFAIIVCLYYTISNVYFKDIERYINQYKIVLDFFTPNQRQLYFFIKGLDFINKEQFLDARENFEVALSLGDSELDLLIKDYYVIGLSKSNKFVDSNKYAVEAMAEFERQTNYVRAMRLRTRIAYDYYRINKFEESEKLYKEVLEYSIKYGIEVLENRCYVRLALLAVIKDDRAEIKEYMDKVVPHFNKLYHYIRFDIATYEHDDDKFEKLYEEYINLNWVKNSEKATLFFRSIYMRYSEENMDKVEYEKNLKKLIELGLKADDGEMIEISSKMLMNFYKQERKYKQGFEVSQKLLHYLENGVKSSKYDVSRVITVYKGENK